MDIQSELREVKIKDKDLLFEWANDSECRKNSLNSNLITYEEHCAWFDRKLNSECCKMYIYLYQKQEAGQIRIDIQGESGQISYSIAKEYRSQGHGKKILHLIEKEMLGKVKYLTAVVKEDNIASQLKFEQNNYEKEENENLIFYKKKLEVL